MEMQGTTTRVLFYTYKIDSKLYRQLGRLAEKIDADRNSELVSE